MKGVKDSAGRKKLQRQSWGWKKVLADNQWVIPGEMKVVRDAGTVAVARQLIERVCLQAAAGGGGSRASLSRERDRSLRTWTHFTVITYSSITINHLPQSQLVRVQQTGTILTTSLLARIFIFEHHQTSILKTTNRFKLHTFILSFWK